MYFFILFHPHIFSKNTKNVTRITLPNGLVISKTQKKKKAKKKNNEGQISLHLYLTMT